MSRKIHIVCVSGTREKLQIAAMFASVAAALRDEVPAFFSIARDLLKIKRDERDPAFGSPTDLTRFLSDAEDAQLPTFWRQWLFE